jgi:type II secretory pathway component GspD/PulD (secretin)
VDTLKQTLSMSGFSMTVRDGVYYIVKAGAPVDKAPQSGDSPSLAPDSDKPKTEGQGIPKDARYFTYKAKARPLPYLTKLAKFAGASVAEGDMVGDVLVFAASEPIRKRLEALLTVVDVPAQAVTIKAALIEFSDTSDHGNSVALSILSHNLKTTFKAGASLANSVTFVGGTLQAAMSAIDGDSRFSYLSRPMLRVLDGESAKLSVGSDVPVRGAVTQDKLGNAMQSVEYRSSGVILTVTPRIVGDLITLKVDQQISSFGATTTSNIDSPSLFKRQASTTVDIRKGQLVILAGLDEDKETNTKSSLNFLPEWTASNSNNKTRSQILLMIEVPLDQQSAPL